MNRLLLIMVFFSSAVCATSLTPDDLLTTIKKDGASSTVNRLSQNGNNSDWQFVISKISSGELAWLAVADALEQGTDAGASDDLTEAVARAIPFNPTGVLHLLDDKRQLFTLKNICTFPVYVLSAEEDNRIMVDSIRSVAGVDTPDGKACLALMLKTLVHSSPYNEAL